MERLERDIEILERIANTGECQDFTSCEFCPLNNELIPDMQEGCKCWNDNEPDADPENLFIQTVVRPLLKHKRILLWQSLSN